ncbi:MAG: ribonuclease J, partial [Candidatus Saccharimonadales bacterium]
YIKLKGGDTVVLSSTPIPGNEISYEELSNSLALLGVKVYRAPTHEVDGCGPLHVSGHANREELREMIEITRPKYFVPIYSGRMHQNYHRDIAVEAGINSKNIYFVENGGVLNITKEKAWLEGKVPSGSEMVDQNGQIVPGVVVKDRLLLSEDGFVVVILTLNKKTGQLLSSPDIITRGFIFMKDNEELMNDIRTELKRFALRKGVKGDIVGFKKDLQSHLNGLLFKRTNRSPLIIPVVNVVDTAHPRPEPAN